MYYKQSIDSVLDSLDSNINGLAKKEATKRLEDYGMNKIEDENKISKISILLKQFQDSMIIMLLIVSLISFVYSYLTGEPYTDTILIVVIVILNVFMGYFQESKAEAQIASLKKINNCKIKVKRDNSIFLIDSVSLVPGDIIILEAGDKVPADARIIEEYSSKVDESILTGESLPIEKISDVIKEDVIINDRKNMIYSGCNVIHGKIVAVVTNTGMNTELGKIASSIMNKKEVPTPLQQKINEISKNLSVIIIFIIGIVFLYNLFVLHSDLIEVIMLCISLMVSAVPEGLPAVISISLSLGASEMAKKNTLIRTLSSIETLGATEIICSDKTGTITKNQMTVELVVLDEIIKTKKDIKECSKYLILNMILCNDSKIINNKVVGDPTETALIDFSFKTDKNSQNYIQNYSRILEIPFDSNRKMMSTINKVDKEDILFSKGSLESILERCKFYENNGKIYKLTKQKREEFFDFERSLAKKALRVMSFAYRKINKDEYENIKEDKLLDLENDLIFSGMVGMIDPPRENVKESIHTCLNAGIIPIMITGDSLDTALAIAKDIDLITSDDEGIEGKDLSKYSDSEMVNIVKKYKVYARVSPNDKVRIVDAWQKNNKVVAMTGDGVNDAPAIKLAHIGIGMGKTGTEVTKSVADVLLLDDCFNTIVVAIKEGRRIYNNIRNVILYSLSSNFAEIFIVIVGMIIGINVLLPIHILYIDLVTDAILSICLAFENASKNVMKEPPHKSSNKFFTPFMTTFLVLSAIIESVLIYLVYKIGLTEFGQTIAQSMAFLCLIIQEMIFAFNCRNLKEPIFKHGIFTNKYMNVGMFALIIIQILVFITPIRNLLHIVPLGFSQVMIIVVINLISFIFIEILKPIIAKNFKD